MALRLVVSSISATSESRTVVSEPSIPVTWNSWLRRASTSSRFSSCRSTTMSVVVPLRIRVLACWELDSAWVTSI